MKDTRYAVAIAATAAVLFAGPAEGQARGRFTLPKTKPRMVVQKPAASRQATPTYPAYPAVPAYPVAFTLLPAVILSDGRIYADFGYGYEPVSRACSVPVYSRTGTTGSSGGGIRVVGANGTVLSGGNTQPAPRIGPAPRMAPHPNQQSDAHHVRPGAVTSAAHSSCYRQEHTGTVVVVVR